MHMPSKDEMTNIDALNKKFMAEWPKRCEADEVLGFLRKEFTEKFQFSSVSAHAKITIQLLIATRENEIKEQVLAEMNEPQDEATPSTSTFSKFAYNRCQEQIDKLAKFFLEKHSNEIRDGGAVDNAIYHLKRYFYIRKKEEAKDEGVSNA